MDLLQLGPWEWVCQMARRRVIDAGRRFRVTEKRDVRREQPLQGGPAEAGGLIKLLVASITTPSAAFSRNQREFRLSAALAKLSPESQTALRLRYVEGLSSKEIAERMQRSDGAVRVLLTRSLQRLRAALENITPAT